MKTFNNKIFVEPYKGEKKIKAEVSGGFARIKQKSSLVGLKVLADALVSVGEKTVEIKKGQTAYFEEETVYASKWATMQMECDKIEEKFAIADFSLVRMVL